MTSRRVAKVAEVVREQVATAILFGLKDPRVKNVTVTRVEVSPDLRSAKVYVSVMGDEKMQKLTLRGLESARGFLQAKLAERVQIRYTPVLHFQLDQGIKRSIEASRLLREVLPPASGDETLEDDADDETGDETADEAGEERVDDHDSTVDVGDDEVAPEVASKPLATDDPDPSQQDPSQAQRQP
ncbi:MAG TPA: 30S ribosome-binding factor RbfA [Planctomycetaceae bacterium]|jgi:ribosome-binding factor A|nr:30S ribosome-binding factor RbfA [Planctomycetaceae bacterium]